MHIERPKLSILVEGEFANIESAAIRKINHPIEAIDGHFLISKIMPCYRAIQLDVVGLQVPSESKAVNVDDYLATLANARYLRALMPKSNRPEVAEVQGAGVSTSLFAAWRETKSENALKTPPIRMMEERRNAVWINLGVPHVRKSKVQTIVMT